MRNLREITNEIRALREELLSLACENDESSPSEAREIRARAEELSRTAFRLDYETLPQHPAGWTEYDSTHD